MILISLNIIYFMALEKDTKDIELDKFNLIKKRVEDILQDCKLTKKERKEILDNLVEWKEMQNQIVDQTIEKIKEFSHQYWYTWFSNEIEKRELSFFESFENNYTLVFEELKFLKSKISELKNTIVQYSFSSYESRIPDLQRELSKNETRRDYLISKYWINEWNNYYLAGNTQIPEV